MIANALPRPLTAGSVDNAILRADGTGGTILQNSGLIVDDAVVAYSVTGDAATDVITATGHNFTTNQTVLFSSVTGGSGLSANTVYFVRNISGNTFQLSTTSGGAAINFTTNITAGSIIAIQANVAISQDTTATDSALVLTPKGTGALIVGPKPDGTATGGIARGQFAVDLQFGDRTNANQVALGNYSFTSGHRNLTQNPYSVAIGFNNTSSARAAVALGDRNLVTAQDGTLGWGFAAGVLNQVNNNGAPFAIGGQNEVTAAQAGAFGLHANSNRTGMMSYASGRFSVAGDAQRARFVMRNKTTTNTAVELFLDGSSTRLTIPSGKILAFTINIAGVSSTGATVAHYMRQYCLKNVAGTTTEVYAPITVGTDNAAGTSIALSASDAADALVVSVTGTASTIWRWVASVDAVEISYGT